MILYDEELIDTEDLFEIDELVLMKATYKLKSFNIEKFAVGIKDEDGDIVNIIELTEKIKQQTI